MRQAIPPDEAAATCLGNRSPGSGGIDTDQTARATVEPRYHLLSAASQRIVTAMDTSITQRPQQSAVSDGTMIDARQANTLWGLFRERVRRGPDAIAYRDYNGTEGRWRNHTWRMISERVEPVPRRPRAGGHQSWRSCRGIVAERDRLGVPRRGRARIWLGCRRTLPPRHRGQ